MVILIYKLTTNKCYEKANGNIRCLKGNELVKVDNYYEIWIYEKNRKGEKDYEKYI